MATRLPARGGEDLAQKGWTVSFTNYENLTKQFGKASDCIACGQCEDVCPQHLPIIEKLKDVAAYYEHKRLFRTTTPADPPI